MDGGVDGGGGARDLSGGVSWCSEVGVFVR
jgi:hypothetical protein